MRIGAVLTRHDMEHDRVAPVLRTRRVTGQPVRIYRYGIGVINRLVGSDYTLEIIGLAGNWQVDPSGRIDQLLRPVPPLDQLVVGAIADERIVRSVGIGVLRGVIASEGEQFFAFGPSPLTLSKEQTGRAPEDSCRNRFRGSRCRSAP